eukprot:TRINITY_DN40498_c0_g1_i1.p1 TRINITY_DN40498_c0_g1~~TRINITY_DN40498_c0_g1_i1.p1  ORF type:complete len:205 (-),score=48.61 TRINITY_DN40498_c0_g1_i1:225-839(-)
MSLRSAGPNGLASTVPPPVKCGPGVHVRPPVRKTRDIVKENVISQASLRNPCTAEFTQEDLADKFVEAMDHFRNGRKWTSIQRGMGLPSPLMDLYIAFSAQIMSDVERDGYPDDDELRQLAMGAKEFYNYLQLNPKNPVAPGRTHQKQMNLWKGKHAEPTGEDDEEMEKTVSEFTRFKNSIRDFTKSYQSQYSQKNLKASRTFN